MSRQNYNPRVWGKSAWTFLHVVALAYPEEPTPLDKDRYKKFFLSLDTVLPCDTCADNFKEHIIKYPIDNYLDSPSSLFEWIISINNEVNKKTNRKLLNVLQMKESYNNTPTTSYFSLKNLFIAGIVIGVSVMTFFYFRKIKLI